MHADKSNKEKMIVVLLIIVLMLSYGNNSLTLGVNRSSITRQSPKNIQALSAGADLYIEEKRVSYIEAWPDNVTSPGIENTTPIIGVPDGTMMEIHFASEFEYALFKVNGSIMSDMLILKGFEDEGGADTIFELYSWNDPYTLPNLAGVNSSVIIAENWYLLGMNMVQSGDVVFQYANSSIEYLLLVGRTSVLNPSYYQALDAIEVHGYTNVMADEENDGIPDIWQDPNIEMYNMSIDIDMHGTTFGIMGLVGVAPESVTNQDFLLPFIKLGIIEPGDIDESHYYIICQAELTLPFVGPNEYMSFLGNHDLLNLTFIENNVTVQAETTNAFAQYIGQDNRVRTYHVIDYTVDGTFDSHDYFGAQNQIQAEYNTLNTISCTPETAQEKFDLDVSIVLDIVENVLDAVKGGKNMVKQFMEKLIGFIQGKILDGVTKVLLEKITKKALKSALKAILSITTIKDIAVKGAKILEKLGVTLPSWLKRAIDFVESIPFIDPQVEIWKVRLTFVNETTNLPILGYDYVNNVTIDSHPLGLYFGDTYSAQIILASRDIFPVIGRIQSVNGSKTLTGNLYIEDFGLQEADHARSSLEPSETAKGRIYPVVPDGSLIIGQCHITLESSTDSTVEFGTNFNISLAVRDENGTLLTDFTKVRAAINNMPESMIELPVTLEATSTFTLQVNTETLGTRPDDHMIAAIYKPTTMFHDYWNYTFILQDTIAPKINNITATFNSDNNTITFSAIIVDYDLNTTSVLLKTIDGSTDLNLATPHQMIANGSHYLVIISSSGFSSNTIYFLVTAQDNSGNLAQSTLSHLNLQTTPPQSLMTMYLAAGAGTIIIVAVVIYMYRKSHS